MRKALLVVGLALSGVWLGVWLLWGTAASPLPGPPFATPSPAPVQQTAPAASAPSEPASPDTGQATQATDEEGLEAGGFDPADPPTGAPDAAAIRQAFAQASGYVQAINSYGYGDTHLNDFVTRAKPYLTDSFYQEWHDIAALADEVGADTRAWTEYQTTRTRHAARTDTPTVTRWTATTLELAVPYRTADIPQGTTVPDAGTQRYARVQMVSTGATWLVQHATTDY